MSTLAALADRTKGDNICAALKLLGLKPVWMEAGVGDQIAVGFEFMGAHPTWTKAFKHDATFATPLAFIGLVNEWKNKVRRDIVNGTASTIVQNMIGAHGMMAVLDAMEDTSRGH